MTEESKETPPNPFDSFSPEVKQELKILNNIEVFLNKVDGLKGSEAFQYVQARQYILSRAQLLHQAEVARLKAEAIQKIKAAQAAASPSVPK